MTKKISPRVSPMMVKLYGDEYARQVADRLEELDPELNTWIQEFPYERGWAREGLNVRDKSLTTVAALIAMGKEEQARIHMRGFLNAGGTVDELRAAILHLAIYCGFPASMNAFQALNEVRAQMEK